MEKKLTRFVRTIIVATLLISTIGFSQDKIEGAFGMVLGSVYDPSNTINIGSLTDGTPMYQFNPSQKFRSFNRYYVMITPKSNKIYSIWGIGDVENTEKGKKEQALIISILKNKYGESEKEGLFDSLSDLKQIDQGNRYIIVKVSGYSDVTIEIRYYDKSLAELAEQERIEIKASQIALIFILGYYLLGLV